MCNKNSCRYMYDFFVNLGLIVRKQERQLVLLGRHYGQRACGPLWPALSPGQLCVRPNGSGKQLGVTRLGIMLPVC